MKLRPRQLRAALLAKPFMAKWLYHLGGNLGWHLQARKRRVWRQLRARPYA